MTNEQYLNTLVVCKNIKTEGYVLDYLRKTPINLKETSDYIKSLFCENKKEVVIETEILENLFVVLNNYRDSDKDIFSYLENYKRFLRAYQDISIVNGKHADIKHLLYLTNYEPISPMCGLKRWKTACFIYRRIKINGEVYHLKFEDYNILDKIVLYRDNLNWEKVYPDKTICAIFITNGKTELIEVKSGKDMLQAIRRYLTTDDYDIAILSKKIHMSTKLSNKYLKLFKDVTIGEYLDLLAFSNNWKYEDIDNEDVHEKLGFDSTFLPLKNYKIIKKSKILAKDVIRLFKGLKNTGFDEIFVYNTLKLLRIISEINDVTSKKLNELEKIIEIRETHLWFYYKDDEIEEARKARSLSELVEMIRNCNINSIGDYDKMEEFIAYKEEHLSEDFVIVGEDGKLYKENEGIFGVRVGFRGWEEIKDKHKVTKKKLC